MPKTSKAVPAGLARPAGQQRPRSKRNPLGALELTSARPERPIECADADKLERDTFVRRLTDALINPNTNRSTGVVVGIVGPWGSGKSSILILLEEAIKSRYDSAIVVRFDPWLVSGRDD